MYTKICAEIRVPLHALRKYPSSRTAPVSGRSSGAVVVNAQSGIELLACKQIVVRRCAGGGDQVAESVVVVSVGGCGGGIGEEADRAVAVVAVEAGGQGAGDRLAFVDQLQAVRIRSRDGSALEFVEHLSIAGGVLVSDEVTRGHRCDGFFHAVAVGVVNNLYAAALHQPVFKVIDVRLAGALGSVAVGVVRIGGDAVVCIVTQEACGNDCGYS